jgi:hypothetical protein
MEHIAYAVAILFVMVLFLASLGMVHLWLLSRLRLRITYLEGTLDMILQSQAELNKLIVAYVN